MRSLSKRVVTRWRRSLRVRVVATTLVLSAVVMTLTGVVLLQQVTSGLLDAKTRSALAELSSGLVKAQAQLSAADSEGDASKAQIVDAVVDDLRNRGSTSGLYDVALLPTATGQSGRWTGDVDPSSIPAGLRKAVAEESQRAYVYADLRYSDGHREAGLVAGAPLAYTGGPPYELYYLFPLRQEQDTVALVRRTVLFAGAALVLLLAGIAALVTRQVVTPVRLAARTAERLAAGRLEERMRVQGEDELARLGTSFNHMAETLQNQISRLEDLSRVQQRFVSDVSHELRTPLTTVRMAADLLHEARGSFPPEVARSAELLQAELDRFEVLLANLLEISRHDAGAVVLDLEPTDVRSVVESVAAGVHTLAEARGCDLRLDLPAAPVVADMDPRRIERVLRNLISNAVEHGEGRPVELTVRAADGAVAVAVRDHGAGLRPGEAALVFNRFWRADPARNRKTGGTGLGLAIALEDTRLHGGWLQAWGEPGHGAVFRLTLPMRAGTVLRRSPLALEPRDAMPAPAPPPASRIGGVTAGGASSD